jgi:hypothetical protein
MRLSAAVAAVGLVCAASSQDPASPQQPPVFRAGVDVVQLEVSILDGHRRPVHGLTKNDVQVFEDSKSQELVEVDEIKLADSPPPPVWARAVPPDVASNDLIDRRLLAIVMDDLHCCAQPVTPTTAGAAQMSDRFAIQNAVATALRLVDSLGPRDLATVALTHDLVPILRFTNDRDALREVIARFAPITEGGCLPEAPFPNPLRDLVDLLAMSPQPVKAAVLLMSPVRIDYTKLPKCGPRSYRMPDTGQRVIVGRPVDSSPAHDPLGLPTIPVYRMNVSGLLVDPNFGRDNGPNLTGGRNFYLTNDLGPAVDELLVENDSYYLVGFRTSRPTVDGKYRRIDVKVAGHGDYTVRARAGYLRPKPPTAPGSRADRNPELPRPPASVSNLLPRSDVTLQTAVAPFAVPGSRQVALVISVDLAHPVAQETRSGTEELDLRTVAYAAGDPRYDVHATARIDMTPGSNRVTASIPSRLDVTPERYELWLTAHDARTNLVGGVFYDFEAPDFAAHAIMLSGVVLGTDPGEGKALPPSLAGMVPIVPTAARLFGQGETVSAFFRLYQGRDAPLAMASLAIRVLDDRGAAAFTRDESIGADRFAANRAADYRLRLPLDTLRSGQYLLTIEARLGDRISPKRDVPFGVR